MHADRVQIRDNNQVMHERTDIRSTPGATDDRRTILIIGISRGIGRGLAAG